MELTSADFPCPGTNGGRHLRARVLGLLLVSVLTLPHGPADLHACGESAKLLSKLPLPLVFVTLVTCFN